MNDSAFCGLLIALIVLIGGYAFFHVRKLNARREACLKWLSVSGKVIKSRVEVRGEGLVEPHVVYEYNVSGHAYQGQKIRAVPDFFEVRTNRDAYQTIDRYPENASVTVYYNPDNPTDAALEIW